MTRSIVTSFSSEADDMGAVEIDARGVCVTNADGSSLPLEWPEWDRLVEEVNRLRPLVCDAA